MKEPKKKLDVYSRRPYDPRPLASNPSIKSVRKPLKRQTSLMVNKKPIIPVRHTKKSAANRQNLESKSVKSVKSAKKRVIQPIDIIKKAEKDDRSSNQSLYNEISFHSGAIFSMQIKSRKPAVKPSHQASRISISSNGRRSKRE